MDVKLDKVITMDLKDPISQFDSTERTYLVNMTALMTLQQFITLADIMQKFDSSVYAAEEKTEVCECGGHCGRN